MKFLRVVLAMGVAMLAFWQSASPAKADPHATFFTATAQKQLFFNVLAALDQADYVEPAGDDPCASGTLQSSQPCDPVSTRSELADKLEAADFISETDNHPALQATRTGLASTLTRGVTIDGTDLWTAYQLEQRALEHDRRGALSELIKIFCNVSLGECDGALTADDVFVTNPQKPASDALLGVSGALLSGTEVHEEEAQRQYEKNQLTGGGVPIPNNPTIAAMWESAGEDPQKQQMLFAALGTAARALSQPTVPTGVFDNVEVSDEGRVAFATDNRGESPSLLARLVRPFQGNTAFAQQPANNNTLPLRDQVIGTLSAISTLPARALEVAIAASQSVTSFHDSVTGPNGERAAYDLSIQGGRDADGEPQTEGVGVSIDAPSYVASGAVGGLLTAISTNDVPQDAVTGPEPNGVEVAKPSGLEFVDQSPPRCYVAGEDFTVKFTINNHGNKPPSGRVWLTKIGQGESNNILEGGEVTDPDIIVDNGTARPSTLQGQNNPNYLQWQTTVPSGGEQTFEVRDRLSPNTVGPLVYNVTFFHTATTIDGTGIHRFRIARSGACPNRQLQAVQGIQDQAGGSGQVLQATTQGANQGADSDLENPGEALVRPHDETGVAGALRALGREQEEPSLLNQALRN